MRQAGTTRIGPSHLSDVSAHGAVQAYCGTEGIPLIVAGGVTYVAGVVFYPWVWWRFQNAIWHRLVALTAGQPTVPLWLSPCHPIHQTVRMDGQGTIVLDMADEVLNAKDTLDFVGGRLPVVCFDGGSPRFEHMAALLDTRSNMFRIC